jgi:hypothetical protein
MPNDVDDEPLASFHSHGLTRYCFGDRWGFAVECEVQDCERDPWGTLEPYGSFWLWVGGGVVGNPNHSEQLALAFSQLGWQARCSGKRPDARFHGMSSGDKLDLVIWARFGEDNEFDARRWPGEHPGRLRKEDLTPYEIVPPGNSPWSDGWEAILVERDTTEVFVWRGGRNETEVHEVFLPLGSVGTVLIEACNWFERFRAGRVR